MKMKDSYNSTIKTEITQLKNRQRTKYSMSNLSN